VSDATELDPIYIAARRVLLNALLALAPHGKAVIVVGAQAVYLRTGLNDVAIAVAPYTTDGDLALDPRLLGDDPELEQAMHQAAFTLSGPGMWHTMTRVGSQDVIIPVDLLVPDSANAGATRGARLGPHGNRAARRAVGLEAALVDHGPLIVSALDPVDSRQITVEVAGVAALLVAKTHKIHDRLINGKAERISDKDASDVYRIMQTAAPKDVAATLVVLQANSVSSEATQQGLAYLRDLFGRRSGQGVAMAQRALRLAIDSDEVAALCEAFVREVAEDVG